MILVKREVPTARGQFWRWAGNSTVPVENLAHLLPARAYSAASRRPKWHRVVPTARSRTPASASGPLLEPVIGSSVADPGAVAAAPWMAACAGAWLPETADAGAGRVTCVPRTETIPVADGALPPAGAVVEAG